MGNNKETTPYILEPIRDNNILPSFLKDLGFVLANDHCARGCMHCPAFGDKTPMQNMSFSVLRNLVTEIGKGYQELGFLPSRTIASWRISDPLDYHVSDQGVRRSVYDTAHLWVEHLKQGLYVVTNGSEGVPASQNALRCLVNEPSLISQIKLTVTPFDKQWGNSRYKTNILTDIDALAPLWELSSQRVENPEGSRFRVNVKTTPDTLDQAREFVFRSVSEVVGSNSASRIVEDSRLVAFKRIYDLGSYFGDSPVPGSINIKNNYNERFKPTPGIRTRFQYAIHPDGVVRIVDMYAFLPHDVMQEDGSPLTLDLN